MAGCRLVRGGLWLLTALELGLATMLLAPSGFFAFSWVNLGMPYNEHLLVDFGAANLAMALVLGVAAAAMERRLVLTALTAFAVLAGVHFVVHTRYVDHLPTGQSVALLISLGTAAAIPLALLPLARRYCRRPAVYGTLAGDRDGARHAERPERR